MKKVLFLLAAAFLFMYTGNAQTSDKSSAKVKAELEESSQKMEEAMASGDFEGFGSFFAEDAMMKLSGKEPLSGRAAIIAAHKPMAENGMKLIINTDEVINFGNYAYELGNYEIHTPDGQKVDYGNYATLWKKEKGDWKIYRDVISTSNSGPSN